LEKEKDSAFRRTEEPMTIPTTTPKTTNLTVQKVEVEATYQAALDALDEFLPGIDPFVLNDTTFSRDELKTLLEGVIADMKQTRAARMAATAALAKERASLAKAAPVLASLKTLVQSRHGKTSPLLQRFGFVQNRTPKTRADVKAAGVAKGKATREALGTKGRQEKAEALSQPQTPSQG
jgi:hypothetical protein